MLVMVLSSLMWQTPAFLVILNALHPEKNTLGLVARETTEPQQQQCND
jgi:hypothetical protein